jgi:hypothetical protein
MMDFRCSSDLVLWPSSTAEVAAHVATQLKAAAAAGTGLKVRVSHKCVRLGTCVVKLAGGRRCTMWLCTSAALTA